ncbi:facilitated trehalose transporter Tret1-like [Planococcus citri]|uniref:facilitated trehalose transporter Tret1-like n=1 Tax=Planococcus citri TaxID=170843 RepID=UPI0031F76D2F
MLQKIPINGTAKQICFGLITLLIYVSMGFSRNYVAFLCHQLDQPDSKIHLNNDEKTWIASGSALLGPIGCIASGFLTDVIGRRSCILIMFVPFIISWAMISVATSYQIIFVALVISGGASGIGQSITPYVSEISTAKYRGLLLALVDVTLNFGVIISSFLMYFFKWNIVAIIFTVMSFVSLFLTFILPESPVWLYSKGKKDQAIEVLVALRSKSRNELEDEIIDMELALEAIDKKEGGMMKKCFLAWRQFLIVNLLSFLITLAGPLIFLSYTVLIIDELKTPYDGSTLAVIYSIAGFCGSFLTPFFMHNFKRKVALTVSAGGMTISMLGVSLYEFFYLESEYKPCAWIVPTLLCAYNILENMAVFPLSFVIGGELFPLEVRGTLQGFFGCLAWISWAVSLKYYLNVMFYFGIRTMLWCLTVACALIVLFAIFILPETHGKTLNEIQEEYFSKKKKKSDCTI